MKLQVEFRQALRGLLRLPGFFLTAVLMLALGIGLSVSTYSVLHGLLLKSLPLRGGESVMVIEARNPAQDIEGAQFTADEAEALGAGIAGFQQIAHYLWYSVGVFDGERARNLTAHVVGPGYFDALGVVPLLGRLLTDEDIREGRPLAVLSHAEWQRSFGGAPDVIGKRLDLIDEPPLEVVGVLPPGIAVFSGDADLWRPLPPMLLPQGESRRTNRLLMLVARLSPGVTALQAQAALDARLAALPRSDREQGWSTSVRGLLDYLVGDVRAALWGALALSLLVLLIGVANFLLLLDARRAARARELAIQCSLGATPGRLKRALLIEVGFVSAAATLAGTGIAIGLVAGSRPWLAASLPRGEQIAVDPAVLAFAVGLSLLPLILLLVVGGLRSGTAPSAVMRSSERLGPTGERRWLPGVAVALATVSVVAAVGLGSGLRHMNAVEPGFRAHAVEVLQLFRVGQEAFVPFAESLVAELSEIPGVEQAALSSAVPLSNIGSTLIELRRPEVSDAAVVQAGQRKVSAGYRDLLGIPLLAGRDFGPRDRRDAPPVALLSASAAERLFPGESAIGRTIERSLGRGGWEAREVVGIVGDIRNRGLREAPVPEVLVPFAQSPAMSMSFLVLGDGRAGLAAHVREVLHRADPRQPITAQFLLADALAEQRLWARVFATTATGFSVLALLLAALGLYALASFEQRRRAAEFGLRAALGARPTQLASLALTGAAKVSLIGAVVGATVAGLAFRAVDLQALGVERGAPLAALVAGALVMAMVAIVAGYAPARRAARVDPMAVLRND